jgi:phosphoglycolate phosphatase
MIFLAAQHLDVEPTRMAMVGDTLVDIQMARAAGSFAVASLAGSTNRDFADGLAGAIIDSIAEIRVSDEV